MTAQPSLFADDVLPWEQPAPATSAPLWSREIILERGAPYAIRGEEWRALFYDIESQRHYGGTGRTAWDAIADLVDDYHRRAVLGLPHRVARNGW